MKLSPEEQRQKVFVPGTSDFFQETLQRHFKDFDEGKLSRYVPTD